MSDWKRTTKEIPFESLPSEIRSAINLHVERYNLGPILSEPLMCVQTVSEKAKKGLFGRAETVEVAAIVTPRWLILFTRGTNAPMSVRSAQLRNIIVQDFAQTSLAKMIPDSGAEVTGLFTDASESVSAFVGLEENTPGNKFREILMKATQDAKK